MNNVMTIEKGISGKGTHILRVVIDTIQQCNLRCLYCHPGKVWIEEYLPAEKIKQMFVTAEKLGVLEIVLSGGEITMHPELYEILEATHLLKNTRVALITNGTRIDDEIVEKIKLSKVSRICLSLDSLDEKTHNTARGRSFHLAHQGLQKLQKAGKPITVISVAYQTNYEKLMELSHYLIDSKLANQHHLCAPSYSGSAKGHYDKLKLSLEDYEKLQEKIDKEYMSLSEKGLYITFNSYWPATGNRSKVDKNRTITLQQLSEQAKDTLILLRSNGDFRLTAASWGREAVGNAKIGNIFSASAEELFAKTEELYFNQQLLQLPREIEALHKFQIGFDADTSLTNPIIDNKDLPKDITMIPVIPTNANPLLEIALTDDYIEKLAEIVRKNPSDFRIVMHGSAAMIIFDKINSHITLLSDKEWDSFGKLF